MNERTKPILPGTAATDYERYLRTDELLSLQKTPDQVVHRDEHLFQTVHQASELWLKLAALEIEQATRLLEADGVHAAIRLLRRANHCMELVTAQLHMLDHLSPVDYAVVRTALGHGAGFDSPGFRRIHHSAPLLGQQFHALLARRGVALVGVDDRGYVK
jgi:tryptophan 2,3-dioxygenase